MSALDKPRVKPPHAAWLVFGRRLTVAAGALTALTALFYHRSLGTASLRGAIAYAAAWIVVRAASYALVSIERGEKARPAAGVPRRGR